MSFLDDFINTIASGIHNVTQSDEDKKKKEQEQRRIFDASEFKKPDVQPQPDFSQTNNPSSAALPNDAALRESQTKTLDDFRKAKQAASQIRPGEMLIDAMPGGLSVNEGLKKMDMQPPTLSDIGKNLNKQGQELDAGSKAEQKKMLGQALTSDEQEAIKKKDSQLFGLVSGSVGGESGPIKQVEQKVAGKVADEVLPFIKKAGEELKPQAEEAVSSILRPFKTTSMGATDLPFSSTAETLPSATETVNRLPSNSYTPGMSANEISNSPSFISKYKSTTAEQPYLQSVLSDVAGDRPFTTNLKDPLTAAGKILRKLPGDAAYTENSIGDLLRGNVVAKDAADATSILSDLQQKVNIVSKDDYIANPNEWGYQGINLNIKTPDGNLAEIQIHTPSSKAVQDALHPLYEQYRSATTVPAEVFTKARKIADDTRAKFGEVAGDVGKKAGDATEQATKLWEENYLPQIQKLLDDSKNAADDQLPLIKDQVSKLENEFSQKADELQNGLKIRKFIQSVKDEPSVVPEIKDNVSGDYKPRANKELLATSQAKIDEMGQSAAIEHVIHGNTNSDETTAMGIDLLRRLQNQGDFSRAIDVVEGLAPKLTEAGRTVQAASLLGRLTPEGALVYTQRVINKAAKAGGKAGEKVSEETAKEITELAKEANAAEPGTREQAVAAGKLAKRIAAEVPSSLGQKISTIQTIAQLLNPKTIIRNLVGNIGFSAIENVKDVVAAPLDMATSVFTKERTKTFPDLVTQAKGYAKGLKVGADDALKGIDTNVQTGKFELGDKSAFATKSTDSTLKKAIYKPIEALERITSLVLKAPDKASYQAAYDESLRQAMKSNGVAEATDDMKTMAHMDGLYRTFQDKTVASEMFSRIKSGLNVGKSFGVGDLVLKYPKTPGNLLARSIEYSPFGFFSSAINLAKMVLGKPMSQKAFVESTARAATGTAGMVATGAILHQLGIISGKPNTDSDIKALQKTQGSTDYQLNATALMRFVSSGFDKKEAKPQEGDTLVSYDWFQPQAVNFAMGADIDANKGINPKSLVGTLFGAAASASNTLVEQPLVSGLSRLFNYGDLPGGVAETAAGLPSSFTPTLLNQVKQFMDNTSRDPQDPDLVKKSENLVKNKIPFVANQVPPSYDVLGKQKQMYQDGSNTFFNVFFNPAFVSQIKTTPEGKEVLDLFKSTGEAGHAPRQVGNTIQINGSSIELNGAQKAELQQYVGTKTDEMFKKIMAKPQYKELDDADKQKILSNVVSDVMMAGKIELFGHHPKRVPRGAKVKGIMNMEDPKIPFVAP